MLLEDNKREKNQKERIRKEFKKEVAIMDNRPIGIFDSGIGGLTVLKKIIEILPNEEYIYYADVDNVPYGVKPIEEVKIYIDKAVKFLISKDVKAIVIACNTATSIAANDLREKYNIPIIGIEPAIKPAIEHRKNKKVLVMATPATIKGEKLKQLLIKLEAQEYVDLIAMPKLVEFAERGDFNSKDVKKYINEQLKHFNLKEYSVLVLGCTHFPLFKDVLSNVFFNDIEIIDGSMGVAKRVKDVLNKKEKLANNQLKIEYYYSGRKIENFRGIETLWKSQN